MTDYRIEDHRVNRVDVTGSWTIAIILLALLFGVIVPLGL